MLVPAGFVYTEPHFLPVSGAAVSRVLSALLSLVCLSFQANESIVAKTTVTVPNDGGPIEAISTIQTVPYPRRSRRKSGGCDIPILSQNVCSSFQDLRAASAL